MNFSIGNLIGGFLFGGIGFIAFTYGKKLGNYRVLVIGLILMVYPYFIPNNFLLYLIGAILTGALYYFRD